MALLRLWRLFLALVLLVGFCSAYNNGVASTPPMGWASWCTDDICGLIDICTEKEVKSVATAMVEEGMTKLGYNYVHLDDCWSDKQRNASGFLQPASSQFPSGMKALADWLHTRGLKLGLYTCIGTQTCRGGRPGSFGYFDKDAAVMAEWGVDLVKTDNCHRPSGFTEQQLYSNFSHYLNATGHPMVFALCEWGESNVSSWGAKVAQMYRIQMDHLPLWHWPPQGAGNGFGQGTVDIIEYIATLRPSTFVRQYGWMDPDFLETLFPVTLNFVDSRTEYTFWSLWSAPLLVATDVRNMSADKRTILMNPEVIAVNQDALHTAGDRVFNGTDGGQVWFKPLADKSLAVVLFNAHNTDTVTVTASWEMLGLPPTQKVALRDLWARKDLGTFSSKYTAKIAPHDIVLLKATATSAV